MANIHDCLERAVDAGELDRNKADQAKDEFDQLVARFETIMSPNQAEVAARAALKEATSRARQSRRHAVLNQLQSNIRIKQSIETTADPAGAILDMFESVPGSSYQGVNFKFAKDGLDAQVRTDLREMLERVGSNVLGNSKDPALMRDIMREMHGQKTGKPEAEAYAASAQHVQKWLRQMFNAHGGDIGEIADYGVRHSHDATSIRAAEFDEWRDAIFDRLDWSRITDLNTGKPFAVSKDAKPFEAEANAFLQKMYDRIVTDSWDTREAAGHMSGRALYNRRAEARLLHFKDGDAWMDYNAQFGTSDPLSTLISSFDGMTRDIALMQTFGPNPNTGLELAVQTATKRAALSGNKKLIDRVARNAKRAGTLMNHATGAINAPEHEGWARAFSTLRHVNTSAKLGSAILSSVTDLATVTSGAVAMGRNPANMLGNAVSMVFANGTRKTAARMGFVADTIMDISTSSSRLTNDVVANDFASKLSGFTIRASGLSRWTDGMRLSVQMETAGHLADMVGRKFDDIDPMLKNALQRNGITEGDWKHLSDPDALFVDGQADFLAPSWWLEHQKSLPQGEARQLATRLHAAIQDQTELFIPSKRMRATGAFIGDTRPATVSGELTRSTVGFKNYALSLTLGQIHLFNNIPTPAGKAKYLATMMSSTIIMGALALQLKEMAKGRDPKPMTDNKFWLAATLQGGGLGIFGDFLFSEQNRFGGGLEQTLAGPVVGLIGDTIRIPASNLKLAAEGKETKVGSDLANFARFNTPVASSFWPTRVAWDRVVADRLQMMLDPEAIVKMQRQERKRTRENGNSSWWGRGALAPDRLPDMRTIGGST